MNEAAGMIAGILYNATSVTEMGHFVEHSLFSSVTVIHQELEKMGYSVRLYEGNVGVEHLVKERDQISFVIDFIPWTRSDQKICHPSLLNFYRIPFVGNESDALVLCADKILTKLLAIAHKIPVPQFLLFSAEEADDSLYDRIVHICKLPFVLKANRTSGSLGVRLVHDLDEFFGMVKELSSLWGRCLFAEEYITGIDVTVPVLTIAREAIALGTTKYLDKNQEEIEFFSHDCKYHESLTCAKFEDTVLTPQLMRYAAEMHSLCGCTALSRTDFRVSKEGKVFFLEINATPDLNLNGAFVKAGEGRPLYKILQLSIDEALKNGLTTGRGCRSADYSLPEH